MNSFAFFASILAQAIAAMTTPITIKDNKPYALDMHKLKCEGSSSLTITLPNEQGHQAYLYPVVKKNQGIELFKLTDGKYVKDNSNNKLPEDKEPGSSDLSVLAKYQIKKVLYTSNNQNPKYSVYVIPPKASPGTAQGKPQKLNIDIQADFECRDKNDNTQQEVFTIPIAVTSN
ncbi:hypothetical protein DSO57_1032793 [Entomophthora muscae]|uniref:Uncharacterized protein n=1 Tax=Entomophthora muscae TaxID=34485 RepID=A0ACC2RR94_9FUNG|nr:hypothetical protein DSO57_1032793 [Entomophthora muscae]